MAKELCTLLRLCRLRLGAGRNSLGLMSRPMDIILEDEGEGRGIERSSRGELQTPFVRACCGLVLGVCHLGTLGLLQSMVSVGDDSGLDER